MAPPPSADLPLTERLAKLAQTLQFAWFAGHFSLLLALSRYTLSWLRMNYYSTWAVISYRMAFISAAWVYGIVVYKGYRGRQKIGAPQPGPLGYLADENFQYLLMALVWLVMPQYPVAILPYSIYSVFHVATYTRANIIPTFVPPKRIPPPPGTSPSAKPQYTQHPIQEAIGVFVKTYYDLSMSMVSTFEILVWARLLLACIFWGRMSWYLIIVYTVFLRARYSQSSHVQNSFAQLEARIDNLVGAQGTHPAVRQGWDNAKNALRQFYHMTDVNQYLSGSAVPKKAS